MSAYKDKTQGTWYVSFRYIDWTGKKTQKLKRGFKTKKEALNYEKEFIRKTAADMKMEMNSFIQVYFDANYAQTECQFRYCGTAIPFLTVRSTAR